MFVMYDIAWVQPQLVVMEKVVHGGESIEYYGDGPWTSRSYYYETYIINMHKEHTTLIVTIMLIVSCWITSRIENINRCDGIHSQKRLNDTVWVD